MKHPLVKQRELGLVAELASRKLRRMRTLTHAELTEIRDELNYAAEQVQTLRDTATQ